MSATASLLGIEEIHTYYGEAHVLQGVSIRVEEGEVVTLIGRNGAGKTTTLRSVMAIAPPRHGRITFRGRDITKLATHEVARLGIAYVPEDRRILPNLTVMENLRLGMLGGRREGAERLLEEALAFFPRLQERIAQRGRFLSGGEQQMLAIARGLVAAPAVMLVDEPTEGLSPIVVRTLTEVLAQINRRGTAILLVEQMLEVALALSHRLYVMDQGRIQFAGSPDDLRRDPTIQQRFLRV
jgi:branched-chain amino acid transport system ATP-binding protein